MLIAVSQGEVSAAQGHFEYTLDNLFSAEAAKLLIMSDNIYECVLCGVSV